jgi:hypothetical protein
MQCVQKAKGGRTSKRVRVMLSSFAWEHNGNLVGTLSQQQKPLNPNNLPKRKIKNLGLLQFLIG